MSIRDLVPGYPAERAGLRGGDRILEIAGRPIRIESDYDLVAIEFRRGEPVPVIIDRAGQRVTLTLAPGDSGLLGGAAARPAGGQSPMSRSVSSRWGRPGRTSGNPPALRLLAGRGGGALVALPSRSICSRSVSGRRVGFDLISGFQMGAEIHLSGARPGAPELAQEAALAGAALLRHRRRRRREHGDRDPRRDQGREPPVDVAPPYFGGRGSLLLLPMLNQ